MLPRRCLPSWLGWQLYGNGGGVLADVGLAVAPQVSSSRVLPGPRQGSCRGTAVVPGKDLAGGLVDFLGTDLAKDRRLLFFCIYDLHKDLHATMEVPLEPWF